MLVRIMLAAWIAVMIISLYAGTAIIVTRADTGIPRLSEPAPVPLPEAAEGLEVMTWNIGYGGLGATSDFVMDGGSRLLPPGGGTVRANLEGIGEVLRAEAGDVVLIQEIARPGLMTRQVDILGGIRQVLASHSVEYSSDIRTRLLPQPLGLSHGLATFMGVSNQGTQIVRLPEEGQPILGFITRRYHLQVTELEVSGRPWTVINVHLSAFDEGGETRRRQLTEALDLAQSHYQRGRAVVMSGDWNMRLADTDFPFSTSEEALFWVHDFPADQLRPGWRIAVDPTVATSRTNEQPYSPGVNYTSIIDGFIVSPNVQVDEVRGLDLGFRHADHQPVIARLSRSD